MSSSTPAWVVDWLTAERCDKYVRAAGGDRVRALDLYEWNSQLSAALLHDLGHLDVGLRNSYDRALLRHPLACGGDWIEQPVRQRLFPTHMALDATGNRHDKNATPREAIKRARTRAAYVTGGPVPRGKVVAEFMFGFWTYLTDALHEKSLWVPALHTVFRPGADRGSIHAAITPLRDTRNRLAHNESIFDKRPEDLRRRIVYISRHISEDLRAHIVDNSQVSGLIRSRP